MPDIPIPIKALVGLIASAADRLPPAEQLPDKVLELPVLAVSAAMQASLRAQQIYAELAARGEDAITQLRGAPETAPAWASFDDDLDIVDSPRGPGGERHSEPADGAASQDRRPAAAGAGNERKESAMSADQKPNIHPEWRDEDADLTDDETQIPVDDRYSVIGDARAATSVAPSVDPHPPGPAGADHSAEYGSGEARGGSPFDRAAE
ncbi:MAG: hypothetical protein LBQ06_01415 [Frankiaceae bacterium]|jgi:hypothetical protein|nr:hypothetical protein [Frankiaceae bacterium]